MRKQKVAGTSNKRSRNPRYPVARVNTFCPLAPNPYVWVLNIELAAGQPSGTKNFEVALGFVENLCNFLYFGDRAEQTALIRLTVQPFTESDDTRCCGNTICPPEDEHVDARNMSRIVM
jgi:hypothetical protein